MLSFSGAHNSRGIKMKVEEQMVPSGGFSPQSNFSETNYLPRLPHEPNYGPTLSCLDPCMNYSNIADTFDLSLLGDAYEDQDMATVPSPMASFEANWQQTSLYAASPSSDFRAYSPDCMKPFGGDQHHSSTNINNGGGNLMCNNVGDSTGNPTHDTASLSLSNDVDTNNRNVLLKRCLEDRTFQETYNFKPVDLPSIIVSDEEEITHNRMVKPNSISLMYSSDDISSENESLDQMDPVLSLVYEQMQSEVHNTSNILAISQDPTQWSVADVQSWLVHSVSTTLGLAYNVSSSTDPRVCNSLQNFWNIEGHTLCSFTEQEFRRRDPIHGERYSANLELWKILQWKGDAPSMGNDFSPHADVDITSVMMCSPAGYDGDLCTSPSDDGSMSSASSVNGDVKVFPKQHTLDTFTPRKFSSPSSVGTVSKHSDDESEDEEEKSCGKTKVTRAPGSKSGAHIHLWQFLKELLESGQQNGSCIRWLDQSRGVFKIEDSVRVARLWGLRKNRPAMNYDKLSRSIRQYYRKGIMRKTERSQRLVYQFCHPYGF